MNSTPTKPLLCMFPGVRHTSSSCRRAPLTEPRTILEVLPPPPPPPFVLAVSSVIFAVLQAVPMTPSVFKYAQILFLSVANVPVVYLMYVL